MMFCRELKELSMAAWEERRWRKRGEVLPRAPAPTGAGITSDRTGKEKKGSSKLTVHLSVILGEQQRW